MRPLFLAAVLALGCTQKITFDQTMPDGGKPILPSPGWTSGTRLRAHVTTSDDGSKNFAGWFDSQRKEDCSFIASPDGKLRCMPSSISGIGTQFGDGGCQFPLAHRPKSCDPAPPKYATVFSSTPGFCMQPTQKFFGIGAPYTQSFLFVSANGQCTMALLTDYAPNDEWYFTAAEIPSDQFVGSVDKVE